MKRKPTAPNKAQEVQAIIDYLVDNGVSEFNASMLLNTNLKALGGYRSMMDEVRDENWESAWNMAELYVSGDMW